MDDPASAPRPTLAAVAARASVSVSTASLVFSGRGPVADATRERVLAAASDLGYAGPDPTARSLRRGRTGVIGVVTEDTLADTFRDPMNLALLDGIAEGLGDERLGVLVIPRVSEPGIDLAASPVDAAILLGCSTDVAPSVAALRQRRVPVVAIEAVPMEGVVAIDLDNRDASRRGAEHLRELGHRDVAVVTLPLDSARTRGPVTPDRLARSAAHTTLERLAGVRAVFPDAVAYSATGSTVDEGARVAGEILDGGARPTAIVAQSDLLAVGVIRAAEQRGLTVPGDLSVLGFDGVRLEGALEQVLTTLVQPAGQKGRAAAAAVLAELAGQPGSPVLLRSELRVGTTTAAPAA
ncbi:MAG TPA: LacI family DNA-binding transcriptional regulator [Pseudolysinimonas sp.]|jgi:DNA-binding LacI/PurR family transcriptional regulator|nr:LacI family DNA-binding transcriptional regulator [Pseudolysinimonas sp.]